MKRYLVLKTNYAVCFQNGQRNPLLLLLGYNYVHNFVRTLTKLVTVGTKKDHSRPFAVTSYYVVRFQHKRLLGRSFLEETVQHQIPSLTDPGKRLVLFCKINNKAILFNRVL